MAGRATTAKAIRVEPIKMGLMELFIEGTTPLSVHKFSDKAQKGMQETQEAGSAAKTKKAREPRDYEQDYQNAKYVSEEGWLGINASSFRNGMISACRAASFVMAKAKIAVFVDADGYDRDDGTPLIRIYGEPKLWKAMARNSNGAFDVRVRPRWKTWKARVRIRYDTGIFQDSDIVNLMTRLGLQVGVGEGRHDSKMSPGIGLGTFQLTSDFLSSAEAA